MADLRENLFVCLSVIVVFMLPTVSSHTRHAYYTPPKVTRITDLFTRVSIPHEYSTVFGEPNVKLINNGSYVNLALDKISGSGLRSKNKYYYGFFSAAIKLPPGLTSGVVVAFYLSNAETYPHNHDEIDIELLGHDKRRDWMFQTNVYANGTSGREEKFYLWFDPTQAYHQYSIIWNSYHTVFFVDNIPVREFKHSSAYTTVYPSKPMSVYATIWDGSEWATHGGKYPVNYKYGPFVASFGDSVVAGCNSSAIAKAPPCSKSNSPSGLDPVEGDQFIRLSKDQVQAMDWARRKLMLYSYCNDRARFKVMPPECI